MREESISDVHNCELTFESDLAPSNFSPNYPSSSNWFRKWKVWCLMSPDHPKYCDWLDSLAAVRKERRRQSQLPNWWIAHPFSPVRFAWEVMMTFVYAIAFATIPFATSFVVLDYKIVRQDNVNPIIYVFFWFDIIFNCFTGVLAKKEMTINLRQSDIFKRYLRGFLLLDVLTSLPYDRITYKWRRTPGQESSVIVAIINLIPLLKISRYVTFNSYMRQLFVHLRIQDFSFRMFSTLVLSLYVIHWFACLCYVTSVLIMYFLQITAEECEECWVSNIAIEDISARYRYALFIVVQNFVASGFGAVEPRTQGHTIVSTILMFLGRIFEAYIVIMFLQIQSISKAAETKYQEILNQLSAYAREKQLPPYMKRRLFACYRHRYKNSYFRESTILSVLSEQLREEILLHSGKRLVKNVEIFKDLPEDAIVSIVENLKFELYLPNDVIVKAGTQGDCMYFLASGTVAVLTPTGKEICHLEDGSHFGEVALLVQDQRRVASVLAIEICEVYRLDRRDFRRCVASHEDLFRKIEHIATKRMERSAMIDEQHKSFLMTNPTKRSFGSSAK